MAELKKELDAEESITEPPTMPEPSAIPPGSSQMARKHKLKALLRSKKFYIPALIVLAGLLLFVGLTDVKYSLFGTFVKKNVTVEVVDNKTLQPVSGVTVKLAGKEAQTDGKGQAQIHGVRSGNSTLEVKKSGYTSKSQKILVRFSTTKLEPVRIVGTGYPLSFVITDKISGKPLKDVKLSLAGVESFTNEKGEAIARILPSGSAKLSLSTTKDGFNTITQDVEVKDNAPITQISLTPSGTAMYVSNKTGKYNVYAADLDGKNERIILAATGKENESTEVYPSPDNKYIALLSNREGARVTDGSTPRELYIIDVKSGEFKKVEDRPIDVRWTGNTLVVGADISAGGLYGSKTFSYNADTKVKKDLLPTSDQYVVANGKVYYSMTNASAPEYGLYVINVDGSGRKKIDNRPFTAERARVTTLTLYNDNDGSAATLNLATGAIEKFDEQTQRYRRPIVTSVDGKSHLFVKGVDSSQQLFWANEDGSKEKQVTKSADVTGNFTFTPNGSYIIFYGSINDTAGVYITAIDGTPVKIANVHLSSDY